MKRPSLRLVALAVVGAAVAFGLLAAGAYVFDAHAAYRSPLAYEETGPTPRDRGLADLADQRRAKREAERRRAELMANLTTEKMVELGHAIVTGRGLCLNCHSIGDVGGQTQGPNLEGVGERAGERVEGLSDVEYLVQSLYHPEAYIVSGFSPTMTPATEPPIALDDDEIMIVVAYLQSLGGTPTVEPGQAPPAEVAGP